MISVTTILSDLDDLGCLERLCRLCGNMREPSTSIFEDTNHYNYSKVINSHFKDEIQVSTLLLFALSHDRSSNIYTIYVFFIGIRE